MSRLTVYRADRNTGDRVTREGFSPRCRLGADERAELIKVLCGVITLAQCKSGLPGRIPSAFGLPEGRAEATEPTGDPLDMMQWIVSSGSGKMPHVSLAKTQDCGGYAFSDRYIFQVDFPGLAKRSWKDAVGVPGRPNALWPHLWMDAPTLDKARIIAVEQRFGAEEVTFFSAIPPKFISILRPPTTGTGASSSPATSTKPSAPASTSSASASTPPPKAQRPPIAPKPRVGPSRPASRPTTKASTSPPTRRPATRPAAASSSGGGKAGGTPKAAAGGFACACGQSFKLARALAWHQGFCGAHQQ